MFHDTPDPAVVLIIKARIDGHLKDALKDGHNALMIRIADMDTDERTLAAVSLLLKADGYRGFVDGACFRVERDTP